MDPAPDPNERALRLPVLPTGRLEAVRRHMQDPTSPPADPAAGAAPAVAPPVAATPPAEAAGTATVGDADRAFRKKLLEGKVIAAVQQIYDPEIPVNIHELGLIYSVDVRDDDSVDVKMTLTAPACPVAGSLPGQVEQKIEEIPEVSKASVELVWDPPWSRDMMSEAAQLQLGLM